MPTRSATEPDERRRRTPSAVLALASILGLAFALPDPASAASAWVKDELKLNIRTGPGTEFRIIGSVETGDAVTVIEHGDGWTQVEASAGRGWIPAGFLQDEPTAGERLAAVEAQSSEFRSQLETLSARANELETENAELSERDDTPLTNILGDPASFDGQVVKTSDRS